MIVPTPGRRRFTLINLFFQYASLFLSMVQGLLLVPLYVSHLSLPLYGAWLAMSSVVIWLSMLDPGVSAVFQQRIGAAFGRRDKGGMEEAIGTGVALNILVYGCLLAAAAAGAPLLPGFLHIYGDQSRLLVKCFLLEVGAEALLSLALTFSSISISVMVFPVTIGVIYLAATASGIAVTAWLLMRGWGLAALPIGSLVRGGGLFVAYGLISAWSCRRTLGLQPRITREEFRAISSLTGYSWVGRIGEGMTGEVDAFLVGYFLGPTAIPLMTMTRNASDVIQQASSRVASAFLPGLTHLHSERSAAGSRELSMRLMRIVIWTGAFGAAGYLALNERFVTLWVGRSLFGGKTLTLLFAGLLLWQAVGRALSRVLFSLGHIRDTGVVGAAEAFVRALTLFALLSCGVGVAAVPWAGIAAAAATGGWFLPRVFSRELGMDISQSWGLIREFLLSVFVLAALGLAWPRLTAPTSSWMSFIGQAAGFSACAFIIISLISITFRRELSAATRSIPSWKN